MGAHAAVARTNLDAYTLIQIIVQVDGHLVPGQVDVATIGSPRVVRASAANIERRHIGARTCRCGTNIAKSVATDGLPSAREDVLALNLYGELGILGYGVLPVLERKGIPDKYQGVLRNDIKFVAEHFGFVCASAVVAQTDRTGVRRVWWEVRQMVIGEGVGAGTFDNESIHVVRLAVDVDRIAVCTTAAG